MNKTDGITRTEHAHRPVTVALSTTKPMNIETFQRLKGHLHIHYNPVTWPRIFFTFKVAKRKTHNNEYYFVHLT